MVNPRHLPNPAQELLLQAALLQRGSTAVFSAFCASRLDGAADVFGLLPAGTDVDAILQRAMPN